MIIGVVSDTHSDRANALPHVMAQFKQRGVQLIIHCGDIEPKHVDPALFLNLPVICALNKEQLDKPAFAREPEGWVFTKPEDRVRSLEDMLVYVGHRGSFDFLKGTQNDMASLLENIRKAHDGLRWYFSGHTHHQIMLQTQLVRFVNPGAVEVGFDGYEYAVVDTNTFEVVFSRILPTKPLAVNHFVGIISDSLNISTTDGDFWSSLATEFHKRGVGTVVHCGNISIDDVGRKELEGFQVYYNLRKDQKDPASVPGNWLRIGGLATGDLPVVSINGHRIYVELDLGLDLLEQSELKMSMKSLELRRKYPEISYIFCGFTHSTLFAEGNEIKIINPGDAIKDRNFVVLCLPRGEVTFGHVPMAPLPALD